MTYIYNEKTNQDSFLKNSRFSFAFSNINWKISEIFSMTKTIMLLFMLNFFLNLKWKFHLG